MTVQLRDNEYATLLYLFSLIMMKDPFNNPNIGHGAHSILVKQGIFSEGGVKLAVLEIIYELQKKEIIMK